ncbi:MAG: hypothetical protein GY851_02920 [bacterium]|nr:hypothetical protein [bacterium]
MKYVVPRFGCVFLILLAWALPAWATSHHGRQFDLFDWSPDGRYLAFSYNVVISDEGQYTPSWLGFYDAVTDSYWGPHEGYTAEAEEFGVTYVANSLGLFSVPTEGGTWTRLGDGISALDPGALHYNPATRQFVVTDMGRLKRAGLWCRFYRAEDNELVRDAEIDAGRFVFIDDQRTRLLFLPRGCDGRDGVGPLSVLDATTGEVETLGNGRLGERIPGTPVLFVDDPEEPEAFDMTSRRLLPVIRDMDFEEAVTRASRIFEFGQSVVAHSTRHDEVYVFPREGSAKDSCVVKKLELYDGGRRFAAEIDDSIVFGELGSGLLEEVPKGSLEVVPHGIRDGSEYVRRFFGVTSRTHHGPWEDFPLPESAPQALMLTAVNPKPLFVHQCSVTCAWAAPHDLILREAADWAPVAVISPNGLARRPDAGGVPEPVPLGNSLLADWRKESKGHDLRRFILRNNPWLQPNIYPSGEKVIFDSEGKVTMLDDDFERPSDKEGSLPTYARPDQLGEAPREVYLFPHKSTASMWSYGRFSHADTLILFRDRDEAQRVAAAVTAANFKRSDDQPMESQAVEIDFATAGEPVAALSEHVYYVVWWDFLWRVDLRDDSVEMAYHYPIHSWAWSPETKQFAMVSMGQYVSSRIMVVDLRDETYSLVVPGWG